MQRRQGLAILALLAISAPASATRVRVGAGAKVKTDPLNKVIELLDTLAAKVTKEEEVEAAAYKEYFAWCDDASRNKQFAIKTAKAKKAKLEASIGKLAGDIDASTSKIDELAASISAGDADLRSATTIREKEAKDFAAKEAELVDIIDTLTRAVGLLEREMAKNPASFTQMASGLEGLVKTLNALVDASAFSTADKSKLLNLIQGQQGSSMDDDGLGAPAAAVYKTHSTGILDVLEDLKEKAEEQLSSLRKAETNAKHNYAMLKQSLEDQLQADNKDVEDEKAAKAASAEGKATAEGDLAATVRDLKDSSGTLESTNANCMQTAADHEATVASRKEELAAIAKAKKILKETTGNAVSQTYSFLQAGETSHLRSRSDLVKAEVVTMVKKLAKEHHSTALAQLASRISAVLRFGSSGGADPFAKVKGLISDLISKLEAEASSEATEKAYCDEQIAKTEAKKSELEEDSSKLTAKIDQSAARSASLKADVTELQGELAALAKEQADMDHTRQEQSAAYKQAKADLELGLMGVRKALGVLREYYGSGAAAAAALIQATRSASNQPAAPELHTKAGDAGEGIIGILEVVESDFARGLAAETSEEDDAEAEYEKTTQENKVSRARMEQDVKYNTLEFKQLDKSIADMSADRESIGAELSAVLEYYSKIKERCIAKPETYESRKARREAEIKGLKEALAVLQEETAFVQRGARGSRAHFLGGL